MDLSILRKMLRNMSGSYRGCTYRRGRLKAPHHFFPYWDEWQLLVIPKAAELDTLNAMLSAFLSTGVYMHLLGTSTTVDANLLLSTCTSNEATFTGYSAVNLTGWSTPALQGDGSYATTSAQVSFTPTSSGGTGNLYGYYLTDSGHSHFYGAEAFSSPLSTPQGVSFLADITYSILSRN